MPSQDTPQQKAALRANKTARWVRKHYPEGTRVTGERAPESGSMPRGTVTRHVPSFTAQGGVLVVAWDSGTTGRHSVSTLRHLTEAEQATDTPQEN